MTDKIIQIKQRETEDNLFPKTLAKAVTNNLDETLENVEANAQANIIESISVNGTNQQVDENKNININFKTINSNSIIGSGNLVLDGLPSQTGNSGKYLTTNGTNASWSVVQGVDGLPSQTGNSGKVITTNGSDASWENLKTINNTSLLGSGDISVITTNNLINIICLINEYTTNGITVRIWSNGLIEQWCPDYTQSAGGAYTITYPVSYTIGTIPTLLVNYYYDTATTTNIVMRNEGYTRNEHGFSVYMGNNTHISFYVKGY